MKERAAERIGENINPDWCKLACQPEAQQAPARQPVVIIHRSPYEQPSTALEFADALRNTPPFLSSQIFMVEQPQPVVAFDRAAYFAALDEQIQSLGNNDAALFHVGLRGGARLALEACHVIQPPPTAAVLVYPCFPNFYDRIRIEASLAPQKLLFEHVTTQHLLDAMTQERLKNIRVAALVSWAGYFNSDSYRIRCATRNKSNGNRLHAEFVRPDRAEDTAKRAARLILRCLGTSSAP